jgi:membrane protein implicated in regulation of membrane protease activity
MGIVQVIFSFAIAAIVAFWLISSIIKVGIADWQIALVIMQILSILLVKISIKELKHENDTE